MTQNNVITFEPLSEADFPLLLQWLEKPHVKNWWDQDITYTSALIKAKYGDYVKGYKRIGESKNPIQAFIIFIGDEPVGYIQLYNAYDFPRIPPLMELPADLGVIDVFIGHEAYLSKGVGSSAISAFLKAYGQEFGHIFVDPDCSNGAAIKCYRKVGFKTVAIHEQCIWMLKENDNNPY